MGHEINCPQCGAAIRDDGKFCSYCGAKLSDSVKRIEVKIDKRIEDVAEITRSNYEAEESKIKQKQMKRNLRKRRGTWIAIGFLIYIGILQINTSATWGGIAALAFAAIILILNYARK